MFGKIRFTPSAPQPSPREPLSHFRPRPRPDRAACPNYHIVEESAPFVPPDPAPEPSAALPPKPRYPDLVTQPVEPREPVARPRYPRLLQSNAELPPELPLENLSPSQRAQLRRPTLTRDRNGILIHRISTQTTRG